MAAALDPASFDEADPAAFYLLGPGRADMRALADATLVVEGQRLPVHSSVLSLQSGVLRGLFADLRSSSREDAGTCSGQKRKAEDVEEPVIEAPFQDCSLFEACLFLRFCYQPRGLTPANLAGVPGSLPGLLRLAHKLDAPLIQQAVCECMADKLHSATQTDLLDWVAAADCCQLPELRLCCLSELARRLARDPGSLAAAFADAALVVEPCDKSVLAQLVGLLATAGGKHVPRGLPAPAAAAAALQQASNHGSFEWVLEHYSQQPSPVGESACSPWFSAAGKEWRFKVYPGGSKEESAGHLSAYISCKDAGTRAKHTITLVDQAAEGPQHVTSTTGVEPELFTKGRGWRKFVSHEALRSRPGYLAGDRLVLRARVEVVL